MSPAPFPAGPAVQPASVLWDDGRLLAVDKPAGVSLATPRSGSGEAVGRLLAALPEEERVTRGLDPGSLWLVHRLDVGTSGVVLLARDEEAHRCLARLLADGRLRKLYLALVWGHPSPGQGEITLPLGPDRSDRRRMRVDPEGQRSRTRYRVLSRAPHVALVLLRPETGRTHQIRVHLAALGHPVVGDDLYGGPRHRGVKDRRLRAALTAPRPLLHAWSLALPATELGPEMVLTAPLPADLDATLESLGIEVPAEDTDFE